MYKSVATEFNIAMESRVSPLISSKRQQNQDHSTGYKMCAGPTLTNF